LSGDERRRRGEERREAGGRTLAVESTRDERAFKFTQLRFFLSFPCVCTAVCLSVACELRQKDSSSSRGSEQSAVEQRAKKGRTAEQGRRL
jgi:hypothetical protein